MARHMHLDVHRCTRASVQTFTIHTLACSSAFTNANGARLYISIVVATNAQESARMRYMSMRADTAVRHGINR